MSTTPTPPSAGWYPAPNGSSQNWWWDGASWTPPTSPAYAPTPDRAIAKLAVATQVLLIVCAAASVVSIGVEGFGIAAVTQFLDSFANDIEPINAYDRISLFVTIVSSAALIAAGVLWLIWQYRAAKQVQGPTRRSPGWHVASWIIPIISFWFPYQNISDLWRATGRTRPPWQILWWLLWIINPAIGQASRLMAQNAEVLEQVRDAMWVSIVSESLLLASVPFAWLIVRGITRGIPGGSPLPAPARWNADPAFPLGR